jgi:predicted nucleic acid-binding protein
LATSDRAGRSTGRGGRPADEVLLDTSAAIAVVLADHEGHAATVDAVRGLRLGLAGHAWFETFSVLTRLGPGARRAPSTVLRILEHDFPATRFLGAGATGALREELARLAVSGGAVYDALVGAAARQHGLPLVSRDLRARATYEALGVEVRFVE